MQLLLDSNQPFVYDIRFSKKSFRLEFYDTACPNQHWTSLQPDVVLLAFDIANRASLDGLKGVSRQLLKRFLSQSTEHKKKINFQWRNDITRYFQSGAGERIPVMMIGLKRDLREENDSIIYPQEESYPSPL